MIRRITLVVSTLGTLLLITAGKTFWCSIMGIISGGAMQLSCVAVTQAEATSMMAAQDMILALPIVTFCGMVIYRLIKRGRLN